MLLHNVVIGAIGFIERLLSPNSSSPPDMPLNRLLLIVNFMSSYP